MEELLVLGEINVKGFKRVVLTNRNLKIIGIIVCSLLAVSFAGCTKQGEERITPTTTPTAAVTAASVSGAFHVSTAGDDANPGTAEKPWRTIQHAADAAQPGGTVYVHKGTYSEEVAFSHSGAAGAPITFSVVPEEACTINGSIIFSRGTSYLNLLGFTVKGFRVWGITLQGDNHFIRLSQLNIIGGEAGIRLTEGNSGEKPEFGSVSDVVIEDSTIGDSVYTGLDCTPGPCDRMTFRRLEIYGSGLTAGFGGDGLGLERGQNILVEDCSIYDNGGDGIDLNSRDFSGNVPGIVVRQNQVYRNHLQGIKLWAGGLMEKNVIWGQGINPVMVGKYPCTVEIMNNTIAYNMYDSAYSERDYALVAAYPEEGKSPQVKLTLVNNIFAFNNLPERGGHTGIYLGPTITLVEERNNVFFSREDEEILAAYLGDRSISRNELTDGTWAKLTGQGQGDLTSDPMFVSGWPGVDLHLKAGSPAAGRGAY